MASIKIVEFSGVGVAGGSVSIQAPILPELRVTVLDNTSTTSLVLLAGTGLVVITTNGAVAMSAIGAISGSNKGSDIAVAPASAFFAIPRPLTLHFTSGA
jgi:hypothetical protein